MAARAKVDTSFDAAALEDEPMTIKLGGELFTVVDEPAAGAVVVFSRRLQQDLQQQLGAVLELLERWIIPDDHNRLYDVVAAMQVDDLQRFMETDLAEAIQVVAARPT